MGIGRYTWRTGVREAVLVAGAIVFAVPFYFVVIMSLKSSVDVILNPNTLPLDPHFDNYSTAWKSGSPVTISRSFFNSLIITAGSVVGLIVIGSLCAYTLARRTSKLTTGIYFAFLVGVIIPFQLGIVPIYVAMRHLHLVPSLLGMVLLNVGLHLPLTVFLYTGFVRALPKEYEEAAQVDGASLLRTYVRVVFPLLRPITGTVAVLMGVLTWNEFFLPLVFLSGSPDQTLPVTVFQFVGEFLTRWNYVFSAVVISLVPALLFYLFAQKQLIRGFAGGIRG